MIDLESKRRAVVVMAAVKKWVWEILVPVSERIRANGLIQLYVSV